MCTKLLQYTRNPGCNGTGKAILHSLSLLVPEQRDWINIGLGTPQQGTSHLQTLLDSWGINLENTCPAPMEKEIFFSPSKDSSEGQ